MRDEEAYLQGIHGSSSKVLRKMLRQGLTQRIDAVSCHAMNTATVTHSCGYTASLDHFCGSRGTVEDAMTCPGCGEVFKVVRQPNQGRNRIEIIRPAKSAAPLRLVA